MARFRADEADNYGSSGSSSYFSLREDGEVKKVRFMYKDGNDIEGHSVHEVVVNGKKRYVECLRDYNSPIDDCPLRKAGYKVVAKLYIPIFDEETKQVCFWERGKKFISKMSSICARYPNVISHQFEIERHGAKGSTDTTYDISEIGNDDKSFNDFPEVPDVLGTIILDKSADEMNAYLRNGDFPQSATPSRERDRAPFDDTPVPRRRVPADDRERF